MQSIIGMEWVFGWFFWVSRDWTETTINMITRAVLLHTGMTINEYPFCEFFAVFLAFWSFSSLRVSCFLMGDCIVKNLSEASNWWWAWCKSYSLCSDRCMLPIKSLVTGDVEFVPWDWGLLHFRVVPNENARPKYLVIQSCNNRHLDLILRQCCIGGSAICVSRTYLITCFCFYFYVSWR